MGSTYEVSHNGRVVLLGALKQGILSPVACDYEFNHCDCTGEPNDPCDGYGRCSTIENATVKSIDYRNIASSLTDWNDRVPSLWLYAVEKIVQYHVTLEDLSPNVVGGYYGEECDGAKMEANVASNLCAALASAAYMKDEVLVEYLLYLEYGDVLPEAMCRRWAVELVDVSKVDAPASGHKPDHRHIQRLKGRISKEKWAEPILKQVGVVGVLLDNGNGRFRLIDGYHRFTAYKDLGSKLNFVVGRTHD